MVIEFLSKVLFYGCVGITIEVFFTGFHALIFEKDKRMPGRSYVWMVPVYGLGAIALGAIHSLIPSKLLFMPIAVLFIYLAEFSSGWVLRKMLGRCPWDYGSARFGIAGLVRMDYLPFWLLVAFCFDQLCDLIDKVFRYAGSMG